MHRGRMNVTWFTLPGARSNVGQRLRRASRRGRNPDLFHRRELATVFKTSATPGVVPPDLSVAAKKSEVPCLFPAIKPAARIRRFLLPETAFPARLDMPRHRPGESWNLAESAAQAIWQGSRLGRYSADASGSDSGLPITAALAMSLLHNSGRARPSLIGWKAARRRAPPQIRQSRTRRGRGLSQQLWMENFAAITRHARF
jgi:hypothetical protein